MTDDDPTFDAEADDAIMVVVVMLQPDHSMSVRVIAEDTCQELASDVLKAAAIFIADEEGDEPFRGSH